MIDFSTMEKIIIPAGMGVTHSLTEKVPAQVMYSATSAEASTTKQNK